MSCSWLVWKHGKLQLCRWNCRGGGVSPCRAPGGVRCAETELCLPGPGCPPSRAQGAVGISGVPFTRGPSVSLLGRGGICGMPIYGAGVVGTDGRQLPESSGLFSLKYFGCISLQPKAPFTVPV